MGPRVWLWIFVIVAAQWTAYLPLASWAGRAWLILVVIVPCAIGATCARSLIKARA